MNISFSVLQYLIFGFSFSFGTFVCCFQFRFASYQVNLPFMAGQRVKILVVRFDGFSLPVEYFWVIVLRKRQNYLKNIIKD